MKLKLLPFIAALSTFGISAAHANAPSKVVIIEKHFFLPSNFPMTNENGEMLEAIKKQKPNRVAKFELKPVEGQQYKFTEGEDRKYLKSYDGDRPVYDSVHLQSELNVKAHFRKNGKLILKNSFHEKILDGAWNGFVKEKHHGHEVDVPIYTDIDEDFKGKFNEYGFYIKVAMVDGTVVTFTEIEEQ